MKTVKNNETNVMKLEEWKWLVPPFKNKWTLICQFHLRIYWYLRDFPEDPDVDDVDDQ